MINQHLTDVSRAVEAVIKANQIAYVTATTNPEHPYGAVVATPQGQLLATATGKTKEDLAKRIQLRLEEVRPPMAGAGEVLQ